MVCVPKQAAALPGNKQEELSEQAEYGIKPGEKELVGVEKAWWKYGLNGWERQVCVKKSLAAATEGFW